MKHKEQKYRAEFHFFHSVGKKMNRKNSRPTEHLEKHKESSSFFIFIFQNCHSSLALKGIASKAIIIESLSKRFSDDYLAKESCNLTQIKFIFFFSETIVKWWQAYERGIALSQYTRTRTGRWKVPTWVVFVFVQRRKLQSQVPVEKVQIRSNHIHSKSKYRLIHSHRMNERN